MWHYHVHVFPRYAYDDLNGSRYLPTPATLAERLPYVEKLRERLWGVSAAAR